MGVLLCLCRESLEEEKTGEEMEPEKKSKASYKPRKQQHIRIRGNAGIEKQEEGDKGGGYSYED